MYKYYLTQRGPGPFCQPKECSSTRDFGEKKYVEEIGREAWGYAKYENPLTDKKISEYELIESKECKYCNPDMSFGNDKLYKDDDIQVFIVSDILYLLKGQEHFAKTVVLNYCPICGKKLEHV